MTHLVIPQHVDISIGKLLAKLLRIHAFSSVTFVEFLLDESDLHCSDPGFTNVLSLGLLQRYTCQQTLIGSDEWG